MTKRNSGAAKTAKTNGEKTKTSKPTLVERPVETKTETAETPATKETPNAAVAAGSESANMDITLSFSKANKSGKRGLFTSPSLRRGIQLPKTMFVDGKFPTSLTLSGEGFATMTGDESSRLADRNAKRVAKGLKPLPTPAERAAQLNERIARREKQLANARSAAAKLQAKLGTSSAPAEGAATEGAATEGSAVN